VIEEPRTGAEDDAPDQWQRIAAAHAARVEAAEAIDRYVDAYTAEHGPAAVEGGR
jgi:hypothetical protein